MQTNWRLHKGCPIFCNSFNANGSDDAACMFEIKAHLFLIGLQHDFRPQGFI
jgi:hypothetical protein